MNDTTKGPAPKTSPSKNGESKTGRQNERARQQDRERRRAESSELGTAALSRLARGIQRQVNSEGWPESQRLSDIQSLLARAAGVRTWSELAVRESQALRRDPAEHSGAAAGSASGEPAADQPQPTRTLPKGTFVLERSKAVGEIEQALSSGGAVVIQADNEREPAWSEVLPELPCVMSTDQINVQQPELDLEAIGPHAERARLRRALALLTGRQNATLAEVNQAEAHLLMTLEDIDARFFAPQARTISGLRARYMDALSDPDRLRQQSAHSPNGLIHTLEYSAFLQVAVTVRVKQLECLTESEGAPRELGAGITLLRRGSDRAALAYLHSWAARYAGPVLSIQPEGQMWHLEWLNQG